MGSVGLTTSKPSTALAELGGSDPEGEWVRVLEEARALAAIDGGGTGRDASLRGERTEGGEGT